MLHELRKVIPSFLRRVDLPDRGGRWSEYLAATRNDTAALVDELFGTTPVDAAAEVELVDFDPEAEDKLLAAICYSHSTLPEHQLLERVRRLGVDERVSLLKAYVGERENRRHKPGRAFERSFYRFDVLSDYGAFRDMQRHRMLTIEWQRLTPNHGYSRPELVDEAGLGDDFDEAMHRSAALYDALDDDYPAPGVLRGVDGVSDALRHAVQRPRGDPHARVAIVTTGSSVLSPSGAGDASADRPTGRPSCDRRRDEPHDHAMRRNSNGSNRSVAPRPAERVPEPTPPSDVTGVTCSVSRSIGDPAPMLPPQAPTPVPAARRDRNDDDG